MEAFDWKPEFTWIAKVEYRDPEAEAGPLQLRALTSCEGFPDGDEAFLDFLDYQLRELVKKRSDTAASAACKVYGFHENAKGEGDRALLEQRLLMATDLAKFTEGARELAGRVMDLDGAAPGLMVVTRIDATFEGPTEGSSFLAVLSLDFEDAARLTTEDVLSLESIPEVLLRKLGRSLLYPYLQGETPRHDLVKLHCRPAKHPFVGMLAINPPPTTDELLQREVARALYSRGDQAEERYKSYFEKSPPKRRELFGEERLVKTTDRLPQREAAAVARESSRTTRDLYSKEQKMKISVDGALTVDVKLEQLGQSFFFAQDGEEKFLIIRGKSFQSNRAPLSSVDFMEIEALEDVLSQMRS